MPYLLLAILNRGTTPKVSVSRRHSTSRITSVNTQLNLLRGLFLAALVNSHPEGSLVAAGTNLDASIRRVRMGTLELGRLKPGQWRVLTAQEVTALKKLAGEDKSRKKR